VATTESPQRGYRAACPNCGAPVEFRSAASPIAVCSFCRSTLAREGDALKRIGQSAELFDDHSPLQLGAAGSYQGAAFTLVGRLQMRYAEGVWNEWHALFGSGRSGWLSEDNGRYVFAFDAPTPADVPALQDLHAGFRLVVDRRIWSVAHVLPAARVGAAEGELPYRPKLDAEFGIAELRNPQDEVGTLDYADPAKPRWSIGRPVALDALALSGLRGESEKKLGARGLQCPSCGAALEIKLETTRSIVCHQCHAVVDVSEGVGGELHHYAQDNGMEPQIPLGTVGSLALGGPFKPWQVVGYVERCEVGSDEDEQVFWREYLLYNRSEGFAFIVDAEDGWSWAVPITGAPEGGGQTVRWRGTTYRKLYDYRGKISYVLGEFYWKLERGEQTVNTDYASGRKRLNREQTAGEVTWSAGETLDAAVVAKAFRLAPEKQAALARDTSPLSQHPLATLFSGPNRWVVIFVLVVVLMIILQQCSKDDCDELRATFGEASTEYQQCKRSGSGGSGFRSSGGSFGGFGAGGGHK
jgi:hypothetical protein